MKKIIGRPSAYLKSLDNEYWQEVRRHVLKRDHYHCVCCARVADDVHHISYRVQGKSIVGKELNYLNWVVAVCRVCHDAIHNNATHIYNPDNLNRKPYGVPESVFGNINYNS